MTDCTIIGESISLSLYEGKKYVVVPMYHPAAALRNGSIKELLRNDFEKLPEILKKADDISEIDEKNDKIKGEVKVQQNELF